jgi:2'-5' RNA ligase
VAGIRAFVAVALDDAAGREMAGIIDLLRRTGADVKWVVPENLHLTLKFLGEMPPDTVADVTSALARSLAGPAHAVAPFSFSLAGVGAFPSLSSPRVVWAGVGEGRQELTAVAARVEEVLAPLGFPPEGRPFSAHLTLGRCRSKRNLDELRKAMDKLHDYEGPRVSVKRVVLYSSVLHPTGPVYAPLSTFELQVGGPN